jgi:hypothetical protein
MDVVDKSSALVTLHLTLGNEYEYWPDKNLIKSHVELQSTILLHHHHILYTYIRCHLISPHIVSSSSLLL